MPRQARERSSSGIYHIMLRGINRQDIFHDKQDKMRFIETLKNYKSICEYKIYGYCLMSNHIHLLIRTLPGEASISRIVQYIKSRFAYRFNKLHQRTGPVWNERFKDSIVEFADNPRLYLLNLIWYFANNPVKAGKVQSPFESYFGGSKAYFDKNYHPPVTITYHTYFLELGKTIDECIEILLAYIRGEIWI